MKTLKPRILSLFMVLLLALAGSLRSNPVNIQSAQLGVSVSLPMAATGALTYALTSASPTVSSSSIDLGTSGGMFFTVTATGSGGPVQLYVSNDNTKWTAYNTYLSNQCYGYSKVARYAFFQVTSPQIPAGYPNPSGVTNSVSVYYNLATGEPVSAAFNGVSSTPQPFWTITSTTLYSITGAATVAMSATAINKVKISASSTTNTAVYWDIAPSTTWSPPVSLYSVSTTPIIEDFLAPGTFLFLSPTVGGAPVAVQVQLSTLGQQ